jgi:DNA-binding NarL/FixJ family response regulator
MAGKSKVLIVDDHAVVIEGLKRLVEREPDFEVIGSAKDGLEALKLVDRLKPHIVIMDISMPNLNGIEATYEIKKKHRHTHVIIYTMFSDKEHIVSLFKAGISAYVLKEEPLSDVLAAMKVANEGGTFYSPGVNDVVREHVEALELGDARKVMDLSNGVAMLSKREREVFPLLADGLTVKEIADRLCISVKTVETHKYNIMEKLHAKTVAGLTKIAVKKELIKV